MADTFDVFDIYEQNINFLFGAGASYGFLPTLALKIKDENGAHYTFETLAKALEERKMENLQSLLFMYYYKKCILPGLPKSTAPPLLPHEAEVINQYKNFISTLISVLEKQSGSNKRCNIYTTNYDNCFELAADKLISDQALSFFVNDGSSGFQKRSFHTKNFNNRIVQKGIFDRHEAYLPQLNLLHPHGSVYWKKDRDGIEVDYGNTPYDIDFDESQRKLLTLLDSILDDDSKSLNDLLTFDFDEIPFDFSGEKFWKEYKKIPIVNPTKWKFHETVFEEAYYQVLRHLSFELERPNTVLITFGFSFADEHILHLIQRSLSNPSLTLYVSCFNEEERDAMKNKFKGDKKVKLIFIDDDLTFKRFNKKVFTLKKDGK